MMMPAVPAPHLILVQTCLPLPFLDAVLDAPSTRRNPSDLLAFDLIGNERQVVLQLGILVIGVSFWASPSARK